MIPSIHAAAGVIGFLCILTFWASTAASELFGSDESIVAVKQAVLWGMWLLVPSMAAAGGTGQGSWGRAWRRCRPVDRAQ